MKQLVLHIEGEGESVAVPRLIKKLLSELNAWDVVKLDPNPFRVGHVQKLLKDNYSEWRKKLSATLKRGNVGGVLLLLDGDLKKVGAEQFCAATVGQNLAEQAKAVGGGALFSVAVVFARQEYESWLIAAIESFSGKTLPDGRQANPRQVPAPEWNLEERPRDAKGWLNDVVEDGYKPTRDQAAMTDLLELQAVRVRNPRSFRRLESAVNQLVIAIRSNQHIVTPARSDS